MKKQAFTHRRIAGCSVLLATATLMLAPLAHGQDGHGTLTQATNWGSAHNPKVSIRPVIALSDLSVVPRAGTILLRTRNNVFATIHTSALTPGEAVTAWWVIFNRPGHCATRPCTPADMANPAVQGSLVNLGGKIIGADGTATFGAFLAVGDTTSAYSGPGLLNPIRAEIHLATRSHGTAIEGDPDVLKQQLSMFNGGCPPNTCMTVQASMHQP